MKVTLAKSAGFCFGVKRAVEMVYKEAETGKKVYTLGPIIHNEQVVQDLEQKGVRVIDTPEELSEAEDATVIIRSHGISADVYHQLEDKKVRIVDATCPLSARSIALLRKISGRKLYCHCRQCKPSGSGRNQWLVQWRSYSDRKRFGGRKL